jgi:hypothetical protein
MTIPNDELTLIPSDSVRAIQSRDGAVLLDIQQGLCFSMTQVGAQIWDLLGRKSSPEQIAGILAMEFGVPIAQVQGDVVAFISDLVKKGLLMNEFRKRNRQIPIGPALILLGHRTWQKWFPGRPVNARLLPWKAFSALLFFDLWRFGSSFPMLHRFVAAWTLTLRRAPSDTVEQVCRAVDWACVFYPKRVLCLQRSAITTCLLRSSGVSAEMVMGAQQLPFKAHAWTEVDGAAVNERKDVRSSYVIWERC